eukprot:Rmarinus@m.12154
MYVVETLPINVKFTSMRGIGVDSAGCIVIADEGANCVVTFDPETGDCMTFPGDFGNDAAQLCRPSGIAIDRADSIYVSDTCNHRILRFAKDPNEAPVLVAGSGVVGCMDGANTDAQFCYPEGIHIDGEGNLFVADTGNQKIRRISSMGVVTTVAGPEHGLKWPRDVTTDSEGNIFVADRDQNRIWMIRPEGSVVSGAGDGTRGSKDGFRETAHLKHPAGVSVDGNGIIYFCDKENNKIRCISPDGYVQTVAGTGACAHRDGRGTEASFNNPVSISFDKVGNVYISDSGNGKVRRMRLRAEFSSLGHNASGLGHESVPNVYGVASHGGTGSAASHPFRQATSPYTSPALTRYLSSPPQINLLPASEPPSPFVQMPMGGVSTVSASSGRLRRNSTGSSPMYGAHHMAAPHSSSYSPAFPIHPPQAAHSAHLSHSPNASMHSSHGWPLGNP